MKRLCFGIGAALVLVSMAWAQEAPALPAGTGVKMKLETPIFTASNKAGDTFAGRVTEAVVVDRKTVIPVGASVSGRVVSVSEPRRVHGTPTINLHPDKITMPDGATYAMSAVVVDSDARKTSVDEEGQIHGSGATTRDKVEIAGGTGGGAVIGALAGGGKGLLIGATVGATVSVVYWLTKRHDAYLPAGTVITMELNRPMSMSTSTTGE
jgi:hypothetical protein